MAQCVNEGEDRRLLRWLLCPLQQWTQITWLRSTEPVSVAVAVFPPLLIVNLPLFWRAPSPIPNAAVPVKPVLHLRIGWRRDMNVGVYIFTLAAKVEERTKLW